MAHLEGVLSLVTSSGPWFRIQGRHLRDESAKPLGFRLALDECSGLTVDVHLWSGFWVRAGWYPSHKTCTVGHTTVWARHHCWAAHMESRVIEYGVA